METLEHYEQRRARETVAMARWIAEQKADPEKRAEFLSKRTEIQYRWRAKHPEKHLAQKAVQRAVRNGTLVRAAVCERCGKACKTEGSHDDYQKRFEVEWLCRQCHAKKDAVKRREAEESN